VTVTTAGGHSALVVVTVRRTTRVRAGWVRACRTTRFFAICGTGGRAACVSATCTAPPPTIAPPHAQAQSFAKAIRTDMVIPPLDLPRPRRPGSAVACTRSNALRVQNKPLRASALTRFPEPFWQFSEAARDMVWLMSRRGTIPRRGR